MVTSVRHQYHNWYSITCDGSFHSLRVSIEAALTGGGQGSYADKSS